MFCEPIWGTSLLILHFCFTALFFLCHLFTRFTCLYLHGSQHEVTNVAVSLNICYIWCYSLSKSVCSIWPDILLIAWLIMATCKLCCKRVLSHAKTAVCAVCHWKYHMNCISINENELTTILSAPNHWYCMFCMSSSLPFIHIKDEFEYEETLSARNKFDLTCESFQEKLFNPFSPKDKELDLPLDDLDPDSNFYNDITYHSSTLCNYYMEDTFKNEIALHSQDQIKPYN